MKKILFFHFIVLQNIILFTYNAYPQQAKEIRRFIIKEAKQAVAVDRNYFYVINSSTITKHKKNDGQQVARWDGTPFNIKHLNSGVVIRGRLYCATSNYPDSLWPVQLRFLMSALSRIQEPTVLVSFRVQPPDRSERKVLVYRFCTLYRRGIK